MTAATGIILVDRAFVGNTKGNNKMIRPEKTRCVLPDFDETKTCYQSPADTAAAAKEEWDSMFGGESDVTVGTLMTGSTVASSLPSAAAVAAMEAEDEGDAKQLIGRLREEQKVGVYTNSIFFKQN